MLFGFRFPMLPLTLSFVTTPNQTAWHCDPLTEQHTQSMPSRHLPESQDGWLSYMVPCYTRLQSPVSLWVPLLPVGGCQCRRAPSRVGRRWRLRAAPTAAALITGSAPIARRRRRHLAAADGPQPGVAHRTERGASQQSARPVSRGVGPQCVVTRGREDCVLRELGVVWCGDRAVSTGRGHRGVGRRRRVDGWIVVVVVEKRVRSVERRHKAGDNSKNFHPVPNTLEHPTSVTQTYWYMHSNSAVCCMFRTVPRAAAVADSLSPSPSTPVAAPAGGRVGLGRDWGGGGQV